MSKLIGDKNFYKRVAKIAVPVAVQMGVTNFVGLLDNIMVGLVGTEQMTGVSVVNQLMFVFNIAIFGAVSGAGIFGSQFYGAGDKEGVKNVARFKMIACLLLSIVAIMFLIIAWNPVVSLFLNDTGDSTISIPATLEYARQYLFVMIFGLIPFALKEAYSSSIKETEQTFIPMVASMAAVVINCSLNAILIFGLLGAPKLGVVGAAIATVISRFVELFVVVIFAHIKMRDYFGGLYKTLKVPGKLVKDIIIKGTPLLMNETMWALGISAMNQTYSLRGVNVVTALSVVTTVTNLFNISFIAMGSAISIMVGMALGAGEFERAKEEATKLTVLSLAVCAVFGGLMALCAKPFVSIYKIDDNIKALACSLIYVAAVLMLQNSYMNSVYFTLRSGGKTFITFLFDSVFLWVVMIPVARCVVHFTDWNSVIVYIACESVGLTKCVLGFVLVKKGVWINRIVDKS